MLNNESPLWLPPASIRSILALVVIVAFVFGVVPIEVATLVLGFYFGSRDSGS